MTGSTVRTGLGVAAVGAVSWTAISLSVGWLAAFVPARRLDEDSWLTRPRRWERDGDCYRSLGVHRWKHHLPETNGIGPGERLTKRTLRRGDLHHYVAEARRAEYVHWIIAGAGPIFIGWTEPPVAVAMIVVGVAFNAPFIIVQRHNRLRALRVIGRRVTRTGLQGGAA